MMLVLILCWGCSVNATGNMRNHFLSGDLNPKQLDLSRGYKCKGKIQILLVNGQRYNKTPYVFNKKPEQPHYFLLEDFVDLLIKHFKAVLVEANISVLTDLDAQYVDEKLLAEHEKKIKRQYADHEITHEVFVYEKILINNLQDRHATGKFTAKNLKNRMVVVSLEKAYGSYTSPGPAIVKIEVEIPAVAYVKIYTGKAHDMDFQKAVTIAARNAILELADDPVFQKYVTCQ